MREKATSGSTGERPRLPVEVAVGVALAFVVLLTTNIGRQPSTSIAADALNELEHMAFVVDHDIASGPGCGGLAVIDVDKRTVGVRDSTRSHSVYDLDVNVALGQVLGSPGRGNSARYVQWIRSDESWLAWRRQDIAETSELPLVTTLSGLAFSRDDETLFLGISLAGTGMRVGAFQASDLDIEGEEGWLPPPIALGGAGGHVPAKIITTRDGSVVHAINGAGSIHSLDTSYLRPAAEPVRISPPVADPILAGALASIGYTTTSQIVFADISLDERYIVTNRWAEPEVSVADLHARRSWTLPLGEGITMTGGVAFNHAWQNPGLLAVNTLDAVVVYRFDPDGPLEELARHSIHPVHQTVGDAEYSVPGNVSWSARGDHLIVTVNNGDNDFALLEVAGCGTSLRLVAELAVCPSNHNRGRAIWTANKRVTPPAGLVPGCPTPDLRPTATRVPIPSPTATPVATPVFTDARSIIGEERVVVLEGSSGGDAASCGGVTHFSVWEGQTGKRARGRGEPGKWATTSSGTTIVVGAASHEDLTYDVYESSLDVGSLETSWRSGVVTLTVGTPIPYGTASFVWGDTELLLTYEDLKSSAVTLGLFSRIGVESGTTSTPLATTVFERGVPAGVALEDYSGEGALMCCGGTAWIVTDLGEVWRLTVAEDMSSMTLSGPIADLGEIPPVPGESGPTARRIHVTLSRDERFLLVSGWGGGDIRVVDLVEGTISRMDFGDEITMIGQLATNYSWENPGLLAVHAGTHILVLSIDPSDGSLAEIGRQPIPPPHNADGFVEPGFIAWSTNGVALIATIDDGTDEFMTLWVRECGRLLEPLYQVAVCPDEDAPNLGRGIFTWNSTFPTPESYDPRCPADADPATPTPSSTPRAGTTIHMPVAIRNR